MVKYSQTFFLTFCSLFTLRPCDKQVSPAEPCYTDSQTGNERWEDLQMDGKTRKNITPGLKVSIVLKQDQRTGKRTEGIVKDLLTKSPQHPHGIKVRLEDGQIGRVQEILS